MKFNQKAMMRTLVWGCLMTGMGSFVWADPVELNQRPRMQSMGGAGLAARGDKDSAMINPAGLADIQKGEWQILPLTSEFPFDTDTMNAGLDYYDVRNSSDVTEKQQKAEKFFRETSSSSLKARFNFYPSYTRKYFHVGLMFEALGESHNRLNSVWANGGAQAGGSNVTGALFLAGGYGFLKNSLQVGITVKPIYRMAPFLKREQRFLDFAESQNKVNGEKIGLEDSLFGDDWSDRRSFGLGADLGAKYWVQSTGLATPDRLIKLLKPAVGVTWQDVGRTRFFSSKGENLDEISQSVSAGFALHPDFAFVRNTIAVDFRNLLQKEEFANKVHLGAESVLWNFWKIRAGLSQLYLTGGMGIDFRFFELDMYVSAQEASEYANLKAQRTVGVRLAAGF